ncbi:hypothetical protein OG203_26065 [Nocardia sp. NBC_01499]|uniref:hypothetical protein n=1 Tax=Nocardia sp. NBC_01499 TaxID=2903597 RepID=UPI00386482A2
MLFVLGVVDLAILLGMRFGNDAAVALTLPVGIVVGMVLWTQVLGVVWRFRRSYLRRSGAPISGAVIESDYRKLHRVNGFDQHRVRIEVTFTHPETGAEHRLRKQYLFMEFRQGRAKSLQAEFPVGASVPMLVRRQSAAFDLPARPAWIDIW